MAKTIPAKHDAIVIDIDRAFSNSTLFIGSEGECKRADYVIISEQKKRVLFIEMKKSGASEKDIVKQLKGQQHTIQEAFCLIVVRFEYRHAVQKC